MNRDQLAAIARGAVTVAIGAALLYAVGRFLGWWVPAVLALVAVGDVIYTASRLPTHWRPW